MKSDYPIDYHNEKQSASPLTVIIVGSMHGDEINSSLMITKKLGSLIAIETLREDSNISHTYLFPFINQRGIKANNHFMQYSDNPNDTWETEDRFEILKKTIAEATDDPSKRILLIDLHNSMNILPSFVMDVMDENFHKVYTTVESFNDAFPENGICPFIRDLGNKSLKSYINNIYYKNGFAVAYDTIGTNGNHIHDAYLTSCATKIFSFIKFVADHWFDDNVYGNVKTIVSTDYYRSSLAKEIVAPVSGVVKFRRGHEYLSANTPLCEIINIENGMSTEVYAGTNGTTIAYIDSTYVRAGEVIASFVEDIQNHDS